MEFSIFFAFAFLNLMWSVVFYANGDKKFYKTLLVIGFLFLIVAFLEGYGVL